MSIIAAYFGALDTFVSVWIFCLMQVIPFFLAFIIGSGLQGKENKVRAAILAALLSFGGFTFVFVSMGMSGAAVNKFFFAHMVFFTQVGGVVIGLLGLLMAGLLTVNETKKPVAHTVTYLMPILFGAAVGFAYKPCVSPTLTTIYHIAANGASAQEGSLLLIAYVAGLATGIGAVGIGITWVIAHFLGGKVDHLLKIACGVVVITLATVILTGNMTPYKRFLVGRFAPTVKVTP